MTASPAPLAIGFLNPALLWFAGLAALPILIWLFNRRRYKPMKWAAMEFVLKAVRSNRSRLKVENLLLLALRVAAVLLIVAALARPVAQPLGPLADLRDRRQHVVLVVDVSYSMGYKQGARSAFERAQKAAHDLAEATLKRGDKLAILLMSDAPRFLHQDPVFVDDATKARVLRDIMEIELSAQPTDAAKTLAALATYLPRFERAGAEGAVGGGGAAPAAAAAGVGTLPKQVFIFTDLQKSAFASDRGLRDANLRRVAAELERRKADLSFVDCGVEDATNVTVARLDAVDEVAGVDIPLKVAASVKNWGPGPAADLTLEYFVDDTLQASLPLSLEAGEEREVERFVVFRDKGAHRVHVALKADGLSVDNQRTLALEAREAVDVIAIDGDRKPGFGDSETDFFVTALAPAYEGQTARDYLLRPRVVEDGALSDADFARSPVVVLANVVALQQEQVERLEAFVRAGGAVLIFLGPQVDPALWNEKVWKGGKGLLAGRLDRVVTTPDEERYHVLGADTFHHALLRPFAGKETRTLFTLPRFDGYWRLEWPEAAIDDPALQVVAWFEPRRATASGEAAAEGEGPGAASARDPALVEKRLGRGRVLLFTSTADGEWNNFYTQYAYLILWQKAVTYLADSGAARKNLLVGEPYETIVPSSEYAAEIMLTTPGQDQMEKTLERIPEEPDRFRLVHAETWKPGAYELRFHGRSAPAGSGAPGEPAPPLAPSAPSGPRPPPPADRVDIFAVNVDPEEGDLARIDEAELKALVPELRFRIDRGGDRAARAADRKSDANELWRYALSSLLGVLALESIVALKFGRRAAS